MNLITKVILMLIPIVGIFFIAWDLQNDRKNPVIGQSEEKSSPQKAKEKQKSGSSLTWLVWIIVAVGLFFAGYYLSPKIFPKSFAPSTTNDKIESAEQEPEPEQTEEPEEKKPKDENDTKDENDDLKSEDLRQTETSTPPTQPETVSQSQGKGKYYVYVGSYNNKLSAEKAGIESKEYDYYEIIKVVIKGGETRYRISIFSSDNKSETEQFVKEWKKSHCDDRDDCASYGKR